MLSNFLMFNLLVLVSVLGNGVQELKLGLKVALLRLGIKAWQISLNIKIIIAPMLLTQA